MSVPTLQILEQEQLSFRTLLVARNGKTLGTHCLITSNATGMLSIYVVPMDVPLNTYTYPSKDLQYSTNAALALARDFWNYSPTLITAYELEYAQKNYWFILDRQTVNGSILTLESNLMGNAIVRSSSAAGSKVIVSEGILSAVYAQYASLVG